jgi:predicted nucleic acid-binding protein
VTGWLIDKSALITAATAELAGLTVLHCDKDFDLIASVTGQPAEWLSTP